MATYAVSTFDRLRLLSEVGWRALSHITSSVLDIVPLLHHPAETTSDTLLPLAPLASAEERAMAEAVVQHLLLQVPQAAAIAVNDAATCLPVAFTGPEEAEVSPVALAVQIGRIARRTNEMALAVAGPTENLQELVLTAGDMLHLVYATVGGRWLLYLAVKPQEINLALARTLLEEAAQALSAAHSTYSAA